MKPVVGLAPEILALGEDRGAAGLLADLPPGHAQQQRARTNLRSGAVVMWNSNELSDAPVKARRPESIS